jgi:hypothetical protein
MGEQPSRPGLRRRDPVLIGKAIGDMVRAATPVAVAALPLPTTQFK